MIHDIDMNFRLTTFLVEHFLGEGEKSTDFGYAENPEDYYQYNTGRVQTL